MEEPNEAEVCLESRGPDQVSKEGKSKGKKRRRTSFGRGEDGAEGEGDEEWGSPRKLGLKSCVPLLYDWFADSPLVWPTLSVRWGPVVEEKKHKTIQKLYLSEQTDGSAPNTLVLAHVEVVKPRTAAGQDIVKSDDQLRTPFVKKVKSILHPGEVNKIRELQQKDSIILTHTDSPEVFLWDVEKQPSSTEGHVPVPDLVLVGHTKNAEFALATSPAAPLVISGGSDSTVLLWDVQDHVSHSVQGDAILANAQEPANEGDCRGGELNSETQGDGDSAEAGAGKAGAGKGLAGGREGLGGAPQLKPRGKFHGHVSTVNDVQFHPTSAFEFCSVGEDCQLLLWDSRDPGRVRGKGKAGQPEGGGGQGPVQSVPRAHERDVLCVDWNKLNPHLLVTGSADKTVRVFDTRKLGTPQGEALHRPSPTSPAAAGAAAAEDGGSPAPGSAQEGVEVSPSTPGSASKLQRRHYVHVLSFRWAHTAPISTVQWCPDKATALATSSDDGLVAIWDSSLLPPRGSVRAAKLDGVTPGLMFQHIAHRGQITEFQWNPFVPWTIASAATFSQKGVGHALQVWRLMDLIYRPEREVLLELHNFLREA